MKRFFDIFFSSIGFLLLLPFFIIIALLIKLESSGEVLFVQKRIGKNFYPFNLYKFRTMIKDSSEKGPQITVDGDARITKVGKFLRKLKIDELPQLINVLKGDMSIVGPRPEVFKYVEMFKDEYTNILAVKPGITDYAAIEFRDEEGILKKYEDPDEGYIKEVLPKKIQLYKKYLEEKSFLTDMKLIFLTVYRVVK